eukprot:8321002-Alexandrium_andersonii.AAC.1
MSGSIKQIAMTPCPCRVAHHFTVSQNCSRPEMPELLSPAAKARNFADQVGPRRTALHPVAVELRARALSLIHI